MVFICAGVSFLVVHAVFIKDDLKTLLEPNELKKAPLLYLILNFIHFYGYAKCQKFDFARSYAVVFFHEIKSRHFKYLNQIAKLPARTAQAKSTKDVGSIVKKSLTTYMILTLVRIIRNYTLKL